MCADGQRRITTNSLTIARNTKEKTNTNNKGEKKMDFDMKGEGNSVLLPEGWHSVLVTDIEASTSKQGNEMYVITTEHPETGSVDTMYAITTKGKRWFLKSFLDAVGVQKDDEGIYKNVQMLSYVGQTVEVFNQPELNSFINRQGENVNETRNKFTKFRAAGEKATI